MPFWLYLAAYFFMAGLVGAHLAHLFLKELHPNMGSKVPDVAAGMFLGFIWPLIGVAWLIYELNKWIEHQYDTGP